MTPFTAKALVLLGEGAAPAPPGPSGLLFMLWPFLLIFLMYMFLVQRPQRKEQMARQEKLANLKKNDHVLLTSGIYGVVTNVRSDADEITVRVDESSNVKLRVTRASVATIITDEPESTSDSTST